LVNLEKWAKITISQPIWLKFGLAPDLKKMVGYNRHF
jgi:hypothetical protein